MAITRGQGGSIASGASKGVVWRGIPELMRGLSEEAGKFKQKTNKGFIEVGILIRRSTETTPPLVPVQWGHLRNTWFTTTGYDTQSGKEVDGSSVATYRAEAKGSGMPMMIFGYTADYATFVHENLQAVNWNRPGSGAKWLESAIERNRNKVLYLLKKNAQM